MAKYFLRRKKKKKKKKKVDYMFIIGKWELLYAGLMGTSLNYLPCLSCFKQTDYYIPDTINYIQFNK